jgi:ABC-2 type transport system permease protein
MTFLAAIRKELMEQWRTYRFLVLLIVLAFFGMTSPLIAKYTPDIIRLVPGGESLSQVIPVPTVMDAIGQYIKNVSQFGIFMALLLSMGSIVQEKEHGTAAIILAKPLQRRAFLGAKFLALALTFLVSLLVAGIGAYYYTLILFKPTDIGNWLLMNLLIWVYMLVYVALTILFSTISRSQAAAAGLSLGTLILLGLVGTLGVIGKYLPAELINWGANIMTGVGSTSWIALGVSLALILGSLVIAWLVFDSQEL